MSDTRHKSDKIRIFLTGKIGFLGDTNIYGLRLVFVLVQYYNVNFLTPIRILWASVSQPVVTDYKQNMQMRMTSVLCVFSL